MYSWDKLDQQAHNEGLAIKKIRGYSMRTGKSSKGQKIRLSKDPCNAPIVKQRKGKVK